MKMMNVSNRSRAANSWIGYRAIFSSLSASLTIRIYQIKFHGRVDDHQRSYLVLAVVVTGFPWQTHETTHRGQRPTRKKRSRNALLLLIWNLLVDESLVRLFLDELDVLIFFFFFLSGLFSAVEMTISPSTHSLPSLDLFTRERAGASYSSGSLVNRITYLFLFPTTCRPAPVFHHPNQKEFHHLFLLILTIRLCLTSFNEFVFFPINISSIDR